MKKVHYLLFFIVALMCVHCTKNEEVLYPEAVTPDRIITDTITIDAIDTIVVKNEVVSDSRKCIYLTIDDAPLKGSEYIDSVILAEKVKTNLFLVGKTIHGSKRFLSNFNQYKKNPYIEIYNHSYSHANNRYADFYKNPEGVLADFEKIQTEFELQYKIARLPGRNLWQLGERKKNYQQSGATSADLLAKNGYKVFGWDIEWGYDSKSYIPTSTIDELVAEIESAYHASNKTFTRNHVIVLMHNQMFMEVSEKNDLGLLIRKLKENNYTFEYLTSYPDK